MGDGGAQCVVRRPVPGQTRGFTRGHVTQQGFKRKLKDGRKKKSHRGRGPVRCRVLSLAAYVSAVFGLDVSVVAVAGFSVGRAPFCAMLPGWATGVWGAGAGAFSVAEMRVAALGAADADPATARPSLSSDL